MPVVKEAGRTLSERLGLKIIGTEGHDLKCACVSCKSSDGGRIHQDTGVFHCYVCHKALSAWDLSKVIVGHDEAKRAMIDVGLFEPPASNSNGRSGGKTTASNSPSLTGDGLLADIATKKHCSVAGFTRYGAKVAGSKVIFPQVNENAELCTLFWLSQQELKGRNIKNGTSLGKGRVATGTGLFLPSRDETKPYEPRTPQPSETWILVEGVKDASRLSDLGYLAAGMSGGTLKPQFGPMFAGVNLVAMPDADDPSWKASAKNRDALREHVADFKVARLPTEITPSRGMDVRDIIESHGPDAIHRCIEQAEPPETAFAWIKSDGNSKPEKIEYSLISCAELMVAQIEINYLIRRLLVACQPMIVSGPKKCLKTSLLLMMAICLAAGIPFLGFEVVEAVTVCIMTGESGLATIKETIRRIAESMGVDPCRLDNLIITESLPRLGDSAHLAAVAAMLAERKIKVLIIDPAYMCIDGDDAGNLFKQGAMLRAISEVCRDGGCTLILCHHSKKNLLQPFAVPELEDIAWAGFQEFARQWMLPGRRERHIPGTGSHRLWLSFGGSAGHGGLLGLDINEGVAPDRRWDVTVMPYDEVKQASKDNRQKAREEGQQKQLEDDRKLICQVMVKYPAGETKTTVRDGAGLSGTRFNRALASLLDDGTAVLTSIIKGGRKAERDAYKLREASE